MRPLNTKTFRLHSTDDCAAERGTSPVSLAASGAEPSGRGVDHVRKANASIVTRRAGLGVWLLAAVLVAHPATAADDATPAATTPQPAATVPPTPEPRAKFEPTGIGKAKFNMSIAEVWKLYPKARLMPKDEQGGAPVVEGPYIDRLWITDQTVPGLPRPATLELRFWNGKLWAVIVYINDNDPKLVQHFLLNTFGEPTHHSDQGNIYDWEGDKVSTSATMDQKWYGSTDNQLSKFARAWFSDMLNGIWKGETPQEAATRVARMAELTPKSAKAAKATPTPGGKAKHSK
jgi:hypothetical protein